MSEQIELPEESLLPRGVGPQLRHAREKLGLSIADIAEKTRISSRHVENIEVGNFSELPGRTYAVGFARSIAKEVGLDQGDVAAMVRAELNLAPPAQVEKLETYEPGDPARAPSGKLVWLSAIALVLLVAGIYSVYRVAMDPAVDLPVLTDEEDAAEDVEAQEEAVSPDPAGAVVFTAIEDGVWVRFYDGQGQRLMETEMAQGDSYTIPADVEGPQLWTGRPEALGITIGGRAVPRLAEEMRTMRDVPVDAASLLARETVQSEETTESSE